VAQARAGQPNTLTLTAPDLLDDADWGGEDLIADRVHGLIVPRRDPDALASAMLETLADPRATRTRVIAARRRVEEELSFDARMDAVERIYEELAALRKETPAVWLPVREKH